MSRRLLVLLYPRAWRERYGREFALLLDVTPLSVGVVLNIGFAAARLRLMQTAFGAILLGPSVTYCAWHAAQYLHSVITVTPTIIRATGPDLIVPPWPVYVGVTFLVWFFAAFYRSGVLRGGLVTHVGNTELVGWLVALLVASSINQWGEIVLWMETGISPTPLDEIWSRAAGAGTFALWVLMRDRSERSNGVLTSS